MTPENLRSLNDNFLNLSDTENMSNISSIVNVIEEPSKRPKVCSISTFDNTDDDEKLFVNNISDILLLADTPPIKRSIEIKLPSPYRSKSIQSTPMKESPSPDGGLIPSTMIIDEETEKRELVTDIDIVKVTDPNKAQPDITITGTPQPLKSRLPTLMKSKAKPIQTDDLQIN